MVIFHCHVSFRGVAICYRNPTFNLATWTWLTRELMANPAVASHPVPDVRVPRCIFFLPGDRTFWCPGSMYFILPKLRCFTKTTDIVQIAKVYLDSPPATDQWGSLAQAIEIHQQRFQAGGPGWLLGIHWCTICVHMLRAIPGGSVELSM